MSQFISADYIFTGNEVISDQVIELSADGRIEAILPRDEVTTDVRHLRGYVLPGFINTHCHLELSHMKGLMPTGTDLVPFIKDVVTKRSANAEVIQAATVAADHEMWQGGVQAVGDISNTTDSFYAKEHSKLAYYTFVEAFDLMQSTDTAKCIDDVKVVMAAVPGMGAIVPHAPYSCTPALLDAINKLNHGHRKTVSIHNQETDAETTFFTQKTGDLIDFYTGFGLDLSAFHPTGKASLYYLLEHMDPVQQYLLVHNTMTSAADIQQAQQQWPDLYWATCANANLYIENRLPNYQVFVDNDVKMTIGTDSLASNWQLSVWEELLTIKKYNSYLSNELLLTWATKNGAEALQMDELGAIAVGKSPGILHIDTDDTLDTLIRAENQPMRIV